MAQLKITADKTAMSEAAAERVTWLVEKAIVERGMAAMSLTGGTTPGLLYQLLADPSRPWRDRIDWAHVHLFWGDEREVPPDHPESNFGLANQLLIQHVPVPLTQIHRMRGELPASDAGPLYDALLRTRRAHCRAAVRRHAAWDWRERAHRVDLPKQSAADSRTRRVRAAYDR